MDVHFYLVYRSPNSPPEALSKLTELIKSVKRDSVMVGDFNLPGINWETGVANNNLVNFMEAVEEAMLDQLVTFPTQVRGNILDLVLTNIPERVSEVSAGGRLGQIDHEIINVVLTLGGRGGGSEVVKEVRNWRRADWGRMRSDLKRLNWRTAFHGKTVDQMWTTVKGAVLTAVSKHVPMRKVKAGGRAIWMRSEIMVALRKKKRLWQLAKQGGSMEDYKAAEKNVRGLIRKAKRGFEKKLADGGKGNSRPFYAYVKNRTKTRPTVGPLKDKEGKTVTEDSEMAELLNGFFSSVFTREDTDTLPAAETPENLPKMKRVTVTEWEVRKKIRQLRSGGGGTG
jgi:hypothetical protein